MYEASILTSPVVPVAVAEAGAVLRADNENDVAVTEEFTVIAPLNVDVPPAYKNILGVYPVV